MTTRPLFYRNPSLSPASFSTFVLGLGLAIVGLASLFPQNRFSALANGWASPCPNSSDTPRISLFSPRQEAKTLFITKPEEALL